MGAGGSPILERRGSPKHLVGGGSFLLVPGTCPPPTLCHPPSLVWGPHDPSLAHKQSLSCPSDWFKDGHVTKITTVRILSRTPADPRERGSLHWWPQAAGSHLSHHEEAAHLMMPVSELGSERGLETHSPPPPSPLTQPCLKLTHLQVSESHETSRAPVSGSHLAL